VLAWPMPIGDELTILISQFDLFDSVILMSVSCEYDSFCMT